MNIINFPSTSPSKLFKERSDLKKIHERFVYNLFKVVLNRKPFLNETEYYLELIENGTSRHTIAACVLSSSEFFTKSLG